jgi:multicomponent Na+:H+ antiporter subunit E
MPISSRWVRMRAGLSLWAVLFTIWVAANSTLEHSVLAAGAGITLVVAVAASATTTLWHAVRFTPRTVVDFLHYTAIFLREIVKSNLYVLSYVYRMRLDLRPGIVATRTRLRSPLGRFVLTNTVTLTPGTLVMALEDTTLFVHALDLETDDIDTLTATVSGPFEPSLARTFG